MTLDHAASAAIDALVEPAVGPDDLNEADRAMERRMGTLRDKPDLAPYAGFLQQFRCRFVELAMQVNSLSPKGADACPQCGREIVQPSGAGRRRTRCTTCAPKRAKSSRNAKVDAA